MPPVPAEFLIPPKTGRGARGVKVAAALVPMILVAALPFILPALVESRSDHCPALPSTKAGAEGAVASDALPTLLPTEVPGYQMVDQWTENVATSTDSRAQLAFVEAGLRDGYSRRFGSPAGEVIFSVFQFPSPSAAAQYESERILTLCPVLRSRPSTPAATGADGIRLKNQDGSDYYRYAAIRGSREYVVGVVGPTVTNGPQMLERLLASAK